MIGSGKKREVVEDLTIISGLVAVQFVYAGNTVLLSYFMSLGLNPLTIVIFSAFATFLLLTPLSFYLERGSWPHKFSLKLLIQLVLIAFGGVTLFQSLFLKGIKMTSPAMATAMPNLAPGLIFVIASAFRLEKMEFRCVYSKVKIVGTVMCVIGAITLSIMQSTTQNPMPKELDLSASPSIPDNMFDAQRIIGCLYLMLAVLVLSSNVVLQASTLRDFPAPVSMCAITSLIGVVLTSIVELIQHHKFNLGWPIVSVRDLVSYSLLGGMISGGCVSFNGWAMKKRGPVLVSMFSPIATVISVILTFVTTGECITLGSLGGMCVMFTGLYLFLWAKRKENLPIENEETLESECDVEKPLLL